MHCFKNQYPDLPVPKDLGIGYCLNGTIGIETMCLGDSGGPAFWEDQNDSDRAYLIAIASHTITIDSDDDYDDSSYNKTKINPTCGQQTYPGIFSRVNVANTLNWLIPNAGKDLEKCLLEEIHSTNV